MISSDMLSEIEFAISKAKSAKISFSEHLGVCTFLCSAEHRGLGRYSTWIKFKHPLLQALLAPIIPKERFRKGDIIPYILGRHSIEPGLAVAPRLVQLRVSLQEMEVNSRTLPEVVRHVFKALGLIHGKSPTTEPIAEFLESSLGVLKWIGWKNLLGPDYALACQLLAQAVPVVNSGRSLWLIHQNSFNHLVFIHLQNWLLSKGLTGTIDLLNKKGEMKSFGILLDQTNAFSRAQPVIADAFRSANKRRNTVPSAHPYDIKTRVQSIPLKRSEQVQLIRNLRQAFNQMSKLLG